MNFNQRQQTLANLSNQMPSANDQTTKQLQAARRISQRQAIAGAKPGVTTRQAGTQAAQSTLAQGQVTAQQAQAGAQQQSELAQQALQTEEARQGAALADQQLGLSKQAQMQANTLASIDEDAKQEVFDSRLNFNAQQAQQSFLQDRQLADYAALKAENAAEFQDYQQHMEQALERSMEIDRRHYELLQQALRRNELYEGQELDQKMRREILAMQERIKEKMRRKASRAANNGAIFGAVGSVIGGVVGGYFGGAGGAVGGASAGGAAGKAAGEASA